MGYVIMMRDGRALFETDNPLTAGRLLVKSRTKMSGTKIKCATKQSERILRDAISLNKGQLFGYFNREGLYVSDTESAASEIGEAIVA